MKPTFSLIMHNGMWSYRRKPWHEFATKALASRRYKRERDTPPTQSPTLSRSWHVIFSAAHVLRKRLLYAYIIAQEQTEIYRARQIGPIKSIIFIFTDPLCRNIYLCIPYPQPAPPPLPPIHTHTPSQHIDNGHISQWTSGLHGSSISVNCKGFCGAPEYQVISDNKLRNTLPRASII